MTVKISSSVDGAPFGWNIVVVDTASFIVNELSVLPMENLSRQYCLLPQRAGATGETSGKGATRAD